MERLFLVLITALYTPLTLIANSNGVSKLTPGWNRPPPLMQKGPFTSAQVTGNVYAPDYAAPTPANLTAAVSSMEAAYTAAAAKATTGSPACPGVGSFGGLTLAAGVYTCAVNVSIPTATNLTLNGSATDVWVFQITGNLDQAANTQVILTGGALPQNVFWQVSGVAHVLAGARFEGIILGLTDITFENGSSINGRLFSQTAVNLNATTVTRP